MALTVYVDFEGDLRPSAGSPVRVEARDTSLADAKPEVVGQANGEVVAGIGSRLAVLQVALTRRPVTSTLWAHVDTDRDGRVSKGDLITTESFPIPSQDNAELTVRVRLV